MVTILVSEIANTISENFFDHYESFLMPELVEKSNKFLKVEDRQRFILGKLLTLQLLGEQFTLQDIRYSKYKKPYLDSNLHFNLSHSSKYVVLAYTDIAPLGIDIEKIAFKNLSHFRNCFTETEWRSIYLSSNSFEKFYELWTKKESISKNIGMGLNIPFHLIQIEYNDIARYMEELFYLYKIEIDNEYACHLSTQFEIEDIKIIKCDFSTKLLNLKELNDFQASLVL